MKQTDRLTIIIDVYTGWFGTPGQNFKGWYNTSRQSKNTIKCTVVSQAVKRYNGKIVERTMFSTEYLTNDCWCGIGLCETM